MKKFLFLAAAVLTLGACTQNDELFQQAQDQEISFQVAKYSASTRALTGSAFAYDNFGVYAWSAAAVGPYYMDNESVTQQGEDNLWKPSTTYYWPKDATIDFISYYPRTDAADTRVKIEPKAITYTGYQVGEATVGEDGVITTTDYDKLNDLMYADKVIEATNNTNTDGNDIIVTDGVNYKTVPAYFHHALARLNVKIGQSYLTKTVEETSGAITKYKWTVKINSATLKGVDTKGDLALTLSETANADLSYTYPWTLPATELWSNVGTPMSSNLTLGKVAELNNEGTSVLKGLYVIPQALAEGKQQITVNMTITTYRSTDGSEPTKFLEETCERTVNLYIDDKTLPAWLINHDITYTLMIAPTAGTGGDDPDPDDPDLEDVEITFDPAVSDWTEVSASATINL